MSAQILLSSSSFCTSFPRVAAHKFPLSSLPLKVTARAHDGNALVHQGLADPQVVLDPLLDARRVGELLRFEARARRVRESDCADGRRVFSFQHARRWGARRERRREGGMRKWGEEGCRVRFVGIGTRQSDQSAFMRAVGVEWGEKLQVRVASFHTPTVRERDAAGAVGVCGRCHLREAC